jgi:hypothetical protein
MGDEQYNDSWVRFVNPIHNPPIADTIAKMARQRASQAPDIRMLGTDSLQEVEAAVKPSHQRVLCVLVESKTLPW